MTPNDNKEILKILQRIYTDGNEQNTHVEDRFNSIEERLASIEIKLKNAEAGAFNVKSKIADAVQDNTANVVKPVVDSIEKLNATIEKAHKTSLLQKLFKPKDVSINAK